MTINEKIKDVIEKYDECNKIKKEIYRDIEKMFDDEGAQKLLRNAYLKETSNGFLYVIILHHDIFLRINFLSQLQNYFGVTGNIAVDGNGREIIFEVSD